MAAVIGWDIGGAHVKAARVEGGRVLKSVQVLCPLWKGLDQLDVALKVAQRTVGTAACNAVTMTGELSDVFATRAEGVAGLSAKLADDLSPGDTLIYGGRAGFLAPDAVESHAADIASANWHASAQIVAGKMRDALFIDMGSTTTDIIPVSDGRWAGRGYSDAERLLEGELVYTGYTRSFLMAICGRAPFRGRWTTLMNEYFATMADVFRILGELDEFVDQHQTADNREKTIPASRQRLARMIGLDGTDLTDEECRRLATWFAGMQRRSLLDAVALIQSRSDIADDVPIIGAGIGSPVIRRLSEILRRPFIGFGDLFETAPDISNEGAQNAPAAAVGLLLDIELARETP